MRYSTRAMFGMLLAAVMGTAAVAEEAKAPWWHFGMGKPAMESAPPMTSAPTFSASPTMTPVASAPAATASAPTTSVATAPVTEDKRWLKWPSMPKWSETTVTEVTPVGTPQANTQVRRDRFGKPMHRERRRNSWAQPQTETTTTTVATPGAETWKKMSDGTKNAWHKTVDFVTPGKPEQTTVASSQPKDSWWHKMWSSDEKTAEGPQTVTEWMAQDRLDP